VFLLTADTTTTIPTYGCLASSFVVTKLCFWAVEEHDACCVIYQHDRVLGASILLIPTANQKGRTRQTSIKTNPVAFRISEKTFREQKQ